MRQRLLTISLAALVAACDLEFLEVEVSCAPSAIDVESEQSSEIIATISVIDSDTNANGQVRVLGVTADATRHDCGAVVHQATTVVDSLEPYVTIETNVFDKMSTRAVVVPVLARHGAARWLPDGALEVPVAVRVDSEFVGSQSWRLSIVNEAGTVLLSVASQASPLPEPLILSPHLIPEGAAKLTVLTDLRGNIATGEGPIIVASRGAVSVAIPEVPEQDGDLAARIQR